MFVGANMRQKGKMLIFAAIVGFDGFCLDDDGGVSALHVLGLGGHGAGDVAGGEDEDEGDDEQDKTRVKPG